jgi:hypothetical protein
MSKVADTGKHHGHIMLVCQLDYLFILYRAAGLDNGGNSVLDCQFRAIREWEESV